MATNEEANKPDQPLTKACKIGGLLDLPKAKDKFKLVFFHHNQPESEFLSLCNEYLAATYHADFIVKWCEYKEFAAMYSKQHGDGELRFLLLGLCTDTYFSVRSAGDFARLVSKTFFEEVSKSNLRATGREQCICCRNRRGINIASRHKTSSKSRKKARVGTSGIGHTVEEKVSEKQASVLRLGRVASQNAPTRWTLHPATSQ
ncbi:hypothetical protein GGI06_004011 [Coemansia sp. S85]|nr:hypothetical protein GGI06_004011 [Coemansia sp. S85]